MCSPAGTSTPRNSPSTTTRVRPPTRRPARPARQRLPGNTTTLAMSTSACTTRCSGRLRSSSSPTAHTRRLPDRLARNAASERIDERDAVVALAVHPQQIGRIVLGVGDLGGLPRNGVTEPRRVLPSRARRRHRTSGPIQPGMNTSAGAGVVEQDVAHAQPRHRFRRDRQLEAVAQRQFRRRVGGEPSQARSPSAW